MERVSVANDGDQGNQASYTSDINDRGPAVSTDGRFVAFSSLATNLVEGDSIDSAWDIFVYDRLTDTIEKITSGGVNGLGFNDPSISADGRLIAFTKTTALGSSNVYLFDRTLEQTVLVPGSVNHASSNAISADGNYIVYTNSIQGNRHVVIYSRETNSVVDIGAGTVPSVSGDGRLVVFNPPSQFPPALKIAVYDQASHSIDILDQDDMSLQLSGWAFDGKGDPVISANGRYIAIEVAFDNADLGRRNFIGIYDLITHTGHLIGDTTSSGNADSLAPSISANGRYVSFTSYSSNLVAGDTNNAPDIFVFDQQANQISRVSIASDGSQGAHDSHGDGSYKSTISSSGEYVAFTSAFTNLVSFDTNSVPDVFVTTRNVQSAAAQPPGSDSEITFISGVTSTATVAATSFATWNGIWESTGNSNNPATYNASESLSTKWGSTVLSTEGTPGGNVAYWFDPSSNWTVDEKSALVSGLKLWSAEANISFAEASDAAHADFTFFRSGNGSGSSTAFFSDSAVGSGTGGAPSSGAAVAIDTTQSKFAIGNPFEYFGGYPFQTLIHEEGHVIGLGHAGPYNGGTGFDPSSQQYGVYDSRLWTLMSYIDPSDSTAKYFGSYPVTETNWGFDSADNIAYGPTTPMMLDILAAQRIYGAAISGPLASGGQIFGFNSNIADPVGQYFDFTVNTHPVITIWDGGTDNTLDLSGFSSDSKISLMPGTFSSANGMTNNIGIAEGTVIDHAIGGSGNDIIAGGEANDALNGGSGRDRLTGGVGSDRFIFDNAANSDAVGVTPKFDHIADYRQGNTGHYSAAEADKIDISGLTGGSSINGFVKVFDQGDSGTHLMVDANGAAGGVHYVKMAQLDGIHEGQTVNVITNSAAPAGITVGVDSNQGYAGNFNAGSDGNSDLIWVNDTSRAIKLFELNGHSSGSQIAANLSVGTLPTGWNISGIGDFNNDGNSDLLLQSNTGALKFWEMNGATVAHNLNAGSLPAGWHVKGTGDFNHDNISDVVLQNDTSGAVKLWEFNGHASGAQLLHNLNVANLPSNWGIVGVGDFNGDNNDDLLLRLDTGQIKVWEMTGNASGAQILANLNVSNLTLDWHIEGIGDFNNDGKSDMLLVNDSGALKLWEMNGAAIARNLNAGTLTSTQHVAGTGDFNGDGFDDILLRYDNGQAQLIELNGAASGNQILHNLTVTTLDAGWSTQNHHYDLV